MKTMKSLLGAIGAGLLFSAQAGAVPLTVTGWEYPGSVTQASIRNNSPHHQSRVYAGGFVTNAGGESFISWCVDIFQNTYFGQTVNDYNKTTGVAALGATKANALGRLATHALGSVNNRATSGAFQLAAWEIMNETHGTWNLTNGNFRANDVTNGSRSIAQGWLNALAGVTSLYNVHIWQSRSRQDLAVFERVSVPEPATLALFIVGLGGAAFAVRARKAAVRA